MLTSQSRELIKDNIEVIIMLIVIADLSMTHVHFKL